MPGDRESTRFLLKTIDRALTRAPSLTDQQIEDLGGLKRDIENFGKAGDTERARICAERAMAIIRAGEPEPE